MTRYVCTALCLLCASCDRFGGPEDKSETTEVPSESKASSNELENVDPIESEIEPKSFKFTKSCSMIPDSSREGIEAVPQKCVDLYHENACPDDHTFVSEHPCRSHPTFHVNAPALIGGCRTIANDGQEIRWVFDKYVSDNSVESLRKECAELSGEYVEPFPIEDEPETITGYYSWHESHYWPWSMKYGCIEFVNMPYQVWKEFRIRNPNVVRVSTTSHGSTLKYVGIYRLDEGCPSPDMIYYCETIGEGGGILRRFGNFTSPYANVGNGGYVWEGARTTCSWP